MTTDKVVDASALAAIAFMESRAQQMETRLRGSRLIAPALLRFEMAHVCLKKIRQRPSDRSRILGQFQATSQIEIRSLEVEQSEVVALAEQQKLSAYDASYLWLALNLGIELVTGDKPLDKAYRRLQP